MYTQNHMQISNDMILVFFHLDDLAVALKNVLWCDRKFERELQTCCCVHGSLAKWFMMQLPVFDRISTSKSQIGHFLDGRTTWFFIKWTSVDKVCLYTTMEI